MRTILLLLSMTFSTAVSAARPAETAVAPHPFHPCVLDQTAILQRSRLAVNMAAHFQQIREQAQQKFENDSRALEADERALLDLRASLPADVVKNKADVLVQRRLQLKAEGEKINHNLADLDNQLTQYVARISEPTVRAVEHEKGCSLLIASSTLLHLDDTSLDITSLVIDRMNAATPTPATTR